MKKEKEIKSWIGTKDYIKWYSVHILHPCFDVFLSERGCYGRTRQQHNGEKPWLIVAFTPLSRTDGG